MNKYRTLVAPGCLLTLFFVASCGSEQDASTTAGTAPADTQVESEHGDLPAGFAPVGQHRNRALEAWIADIEGDDRFKRFKALVAVGEMEQAGLPAVPAINKVLADTTIDGGIQRKAIAALGRIGGEEAVQGLDASIRGADQIIGLLAADALGAMGSWAVDRIIPYLSSTNPAVRERGVRALKNVLHTDGKVTRMEAAVIPLANAVTDSNSAVRQEALGVLSELGERAVAATPVIIEKLRTEENYDQRKLLMVMIGMFGPTAAEAAPMLREDLDRGDIQLRLFAALTLAKIGFVDEGLGPILELLEHDDEQLRLAAVDGLRRIGPPAIGAVDALKEARKGADDSMHMMVEHALKAIRGES